MTEEELKNKCTERAKIFQQAMESCKSSSPMDCIEWFADRIADLEKENAELKKQNKNLQVMLQAEREVRVNEDYLKKITDLEAENEELKEKLKPENCLKLLAKDGYIKFTSEHLTKAKELLKQFLEIKNWEDTYKIECEAEQFLREVENK